MKRFVTAASIAGCMWLGLAAPAAAIILHGSGDSSLGGPDTRVGVEVEMNPCIADRTGLIPGSTDGGMNPCISDGVLEAGHAEVVVGVRNEEGRR